MHALSRTTEAESQPQRPVMYVLYQRETGEPRVWERSGFIDIWLQRRAGSFSQKPGGLHRRPLSSATVQTLSPTLKFVLSLGYDSNPARDPAHHRGGAGRARRLLSHPERIPLGHCTLSCLLKQQSWHTGP